LIWQALIRTLERAVRGLRSVRFAVILMAIIALACIVGTLVKQEPYNPNHAVEYYGRTLGLLIGLLYLNQIYGTWWFLTLLSLFALSSTVCAFSRRRLTLRGAGSLIAHASVLFIVAGVLVRALVGVSGFASIPEGKTAQAFETADHRSVPMGFGLRLDDFQVKRHEGRSDFVSVKLPGEKEAREIPAKADKVTDLGKGWSLKVLRRLLHFMKDGERAYSASERAANPAVEVEIDGPNGKSKRWLFARFPDYHGHELGEKDAELRYVWAEAPVKEFESHVTIVGEEPGAPERKAVIRVNQPLKAGRYTIYQSGYDRRTEATTTLEVSYDPGVPFVIVGFVLLPLGMAFTLYIKPLLGRKGHKDV